MDARLRDHEYDRRIKFADVSDDLSDGRKGKRRNGKREAFAKISRRARITRRARVSCESRETKLAASIGRHGPLGTDPWQVPLNVLRTRGGRTPKGLLPPVKLTAMAATVRYRVSRISPKATNACVEP